MKSKSDILVVEDEPVVIESAKKILVPEGFIVDGAVNAEIALEKLQQHEYKLILSDLMLPKISGFELIEEAKRKCPKTPIIMITGYATFENAVKSFKLGVFDFIPKPFDIDELLGVVNRALKFSERTKSNKKGKKPIEWLGKQHFCEDKIENLYFLGQHAWAMLDRDGSSTMGVGETFLSIVEDIRRIEFPTVNEEMSQGNVCVRITTDEQLVHRVWAPLSGTVIKINHHVKQNANLINVDPFHQGWLVRIIPTNLENELENLTICQT